MVFIIPYKKGSKGAQALATALKAKRIKLEGSRFIGNQSKVVLNWGCSEIDNQQVLKCTLLNPPETLKLASNKLEFFKALGHDFRSIPEWTEEKAVARGWLDNGESVVARHLLSSHSGKGIKLYTGTQDIPRFDQMIEAPLYVKYIKKEEEYRVHVFNGEVIDIQRKARRHDTVDEEVNWQIRNHDNGFIYARHHTDGEHVPEFQKMCSLALMLMEEFELDFGAVDIIYNTHHNRHYALEINTAPGLEGHTIMKYAEAIRKMIHS